MPDAMKNQGFPAKLRMAVSRWLAGAGLFICLLIAPAGASELIMLNEPGCMWCERWEREVGQIYNKTPESKRAPIRRLNIHKPLPSELKFLVKGHYTPTFILVAEGREIGRIKGYPGEDFFWGLLGQMLGRLPAAAAGGTNAH